MSRLSDNLGGNVGNIGSALFAFFGVLGAISALGLSLAAVRKWPMLALWGVALFALAAWEIPAPPTLVGVAGFQVKPEDIVFVIIALDTMLHHQRLLAITRRYNALMILVGLCLVSSLVVGLIAYGSPAINEARNFFWGVTLVAWMLNQDWASEDLKKRFGRWGILVGWALVGIFLYHAARYGLGAADSFVVVTEGQEQTGRPLVSGQAVLLACLGFMMFGTASARGKKRVVSALVFITVAALCQHRSVWVAIAIAIVLALLKLRGRALVNTVFWGLYGVLIVSIFYVAGAFDALLEQLSYSASSTGTYVERADSWQLLIAQAVDKGPWTVVFGEPFGSGYERVVDGKFVTYSPHNWFVMIFLRLGLFGFLTYMLLMFGLILPKLMRRGGMAAVMLIALLVYSWTYALPWYLSPIIGWCAYEAWYGIKPKEKPALVKAQALPPAYAHLAARAASRPPRLG